MARRELARTECQIEFNCHAAKDRLNNPAVGPAMPDADPGADADSGPTVDVARHLPSPPGRGAGGEGKKPLDPDLLAFARQLRQQQTDAERLLWALLRDRRLAGLKFRRQHPIEPYVLDFYCPEARLAIELDGGQHNEPEVRVHDAQRTSYLSERGIRVLRFWNNEVLSQTEAVLQRIYEALTPALSRGERERDAYPGRVFGSPQAKGRAGLGVEAPVARSGQRLRHAEWRGDLLGTGIPGIAGRHIE